MADLTVTLDSVREASLMSAYAKENDILQKAFDANKDPAKSPLKLWTRESYAQMLMETWTDSHGRNNQEFLLTQALQRYPTLSDAARGQLLATLGMSGFSGLSMPDQLLALQAAAAKRFLNLPREQQNQMFALLGF